MFGNMVSKLKEAQDLMEETKIRMESIYINTEAENGMVKIILNANKKIKDISIDNSLMSISEKERLEELLAVALNKGMEKADKIFDEEMQGMSKGIFPGFPFLF
jgi:DNA-binding YbaB/EbfC family protein